MFGSSWPWSPFVWLVGVEEVEEVVEVMEELLAEGGRW